MTLRKLLPWVKISSHWIEANGLRHFRWAYGEGSNNLAALMALTVINHHVDPETGTAHLTYDEMCHVASLSRSKLSAGLNILSERNLIVRSSAHQSVYQLEGYPLTRDWAQFPAKGLYTDSQIRFFAELNLRLPAELDALKLYYLFASRRDKKTNLAHITYDQIEAYSGIPRVNIRRAISFLAGHGLIHIEHIPRKMNENGIASAYRLAQLNTHRHMGTIGRDDDIFEPFGRS